MADLYFGLAAAKPLPPAEQRELLREMAAARGAKPQRKREYLALRNRILAANLRLVVSIAKRFHGLPLDDLISEGVLGAIRGFETFDPERAFALSTYLNWWIKHYIRRAIHNRARTIRIPVHLQEANARLRRAAEKFESRHGRKPSAEELAAASGLPVKMVARVDDAAGEPFSLDAPVADPEGATTWHDYTPALGESAIDTVLEKERAAEGRTAFESIANPRSREIVEGRFGFGARRGEESTLQEIGDRLHLSRERVRQIERDALDKLREATHSSSA